MDLKDILKSKEEAKVQNYWSLIIEPGWVQAGIWNVQEGKVNFICYSPAVAWDLDQDLVSSSDTALSSCIQKLPEEENEPSDVVFGLPGFWISEGNIKGDYLAKIKKICSDLSLKPAGFVVLSEAIAHYIKTNEGAPLTAVVIGVYGDNIEVTVFRLGKILGTTLVSRSVSIFDDVVEGLSRLSSVESFPSRFILFDSKEGDLEEIKQSLISAEWNLDKVKLLHAPKVETIPPEKKVIATSLAGGLELASAKAVNIIEGNADEKESKVEENRSELLQTEDIKAEDLGFVLGEDVAQKSKDMEKEQVELQVGSEAEKVTKPVLKEISEGVSKELPQKQPKFLDRVKSLRQVFYSLLMKIGNKKDKPALEDKIKKPRLGSRKLIIIFIIPILLLVIGGFLSWWYLPKAVVKVFVSPQKLEKDETINVEEGAVGVDLASRVIPGELKSEDVEGEKTISTTGTKTVGEKAKGEVTIYRSGSELKLDAGTVLSTSSGLEFTLDDDVTIASGSASSPGTTKAKVSAGKIGAEYNLASGESFNVGNYPSSDLEAKNEDSFSGGSSREVSVVSDDDQKKLEEDLTKELVEKGLGKIESSLSSDKYIIDESATTEVLDKTYDKKVGDEAVTLKLSLSLKVSVLIINKKNLTDLAKSVLQNEISEGYTLNNDQIKVKFDFLGKEENKYQLNAKFIVNLLPRVNVEDIRREISGKYPEIAKDYLSNIKGFEKVKVVRKPALPGKLGTLPRVPKNISIEVEAF